MAKKYIFIDTNIYIFCSLMTKDGAHNIELFKDILKKLNQSNDFVLLVPDIVKLEYTRVSKNSFKYKSNKIGKAKKALDLLVGDNTLTTEEKNKMTKTYDEILERIKKNKSRFETLFGKIISHKNVKFIEMTPEVMVNGYKRAVLGTKPYKIQKNGDDKVYMNKLVAMPIDQDCMIIESLIGYFDNPKNKVPKNSELLFCTDNSSDFQSNKKLEIHPEIKKDFKSGLKIKFYSKLPGLITKEFGTKISKAVEKEYISLSETTSAIKRASDAIKNSPVYDSIHELSKISQQVGSFYNTPLFKQLGKNLEFLSIVNQVPDLGDSFKNLEFPTVANIKMNSILDDYRHIVPQLKCSKCGGMFNHSIYRSAIYHDRCDNCQTLT